MRFLTAALVLATVMVATLVCPAAAREGLADIRWTTPATTGSLLVVMVRNADGLPILTVQEPVEEGATQTALPLPPLTRQASSVQAGLIERGRVLAQSPVKPVSAREIDLKLELRSLLAVGFYDHWFCEDSARLVRTSSLPEGLELHYRGAITLLSPDDTEDHYSAGKETRFVLEDDLAEITVAGEAFGACRASLFSPIMPMTILGREEDWTVAIGLEDALLTLPGLEQETVLSSGIRIRSLRDGEIRIMAPTLAITLLDKGCRTRNAGLPYPVTAELHQEGAPEARPGCAGNPLDLLAGGTWKARSLFGLPLAPETPMLTLQVVGSEISGRMACNRYVGTAGITDGQLSFSELGATRLACPAEQKNMERRFLDALEIATGFDLWSNGTLSLRAGPIVVMTATRE